MEFLFPIAGEISLARESIDSVQKRLTGKFFASHPERLKRAIIIQRNTAVVEKIFIANQVHTALGIKKSYVFLQFTAVFE